MEFFFLLYGVLVTHWLCSFLPESIVAGRRIFFAALITVLIGIFGILFMAEREAVVYPETVFFSAAVVLGSIWGIILAYFLFTWSEVQDLPVSERKEYVKNWLAPYHSNAATFGVSAVSGLILVHQFILFAPENPNLKLFLVLIYLPVLSGFILKLTGARSVLLALLTYYFYQQLKLLLLTESYNCAVPSLTVIAALFSVSAVIALIFFPLPKRFALSLLLLAGASELVPLYNFLYSPGCRVTLSESRAVNNTATGNENRYRLVLPDEDYQFITRTQYERLAGNSPEAGDLFFVRGKGEAYGVIEVYEIDPVEAGAGIKETIEAGYAAERSRFWSEYGRLHFFKDELNESGFSMHFTFNRGSDRGSVVHSLRYRDDLVFILTVKSNSWLSAEKMAELANVEAGIKVN